MNSKRITGFLLVLFFIITIPIYAKDSFSTKNAYNITKELSTNKYKGRLVGDIGNQLARDYIKDYFKKIGLKPGGDNKSYLQAFDVYVPYVTDTGYFKVYDTSSKLVKEYKYGQDFKEMTYGASVSGSISGKLKSVLRTEASIMISENINTTLENPKGYINDYELMSGGIKAVIVPGDEYLRFRSPHKLQKSYNEGLIKIYISRRIVPELRSYAEKNYTFEIKSSINVKLTKGSNIIGILEGKNKNLPPLILSAHFDHVGFDGDGVIYPGTFDNASGTGFLLECARNLSSLDQPERTIIFIAFDGEEVGLIGSKYFVENPPMDISKAECINFDMVGSPDKLPVSIIYSSQMSEFADEMLDISRLENIPAKASLNDSSDHAYFCASGIKAVTLIQYDVSKIHTPEDTIEYISEKGFNDVYKILDAYLATREVYSSSLNLQASDPSIRYLLPGAAILIITTLVTLYTINVKNSENGFKKR